MEWWRNALWGDHIDMKTKDEVITVMQNIVDGVANNRQTYNREDDVHGTAQSQNQTP